MLINHSEPILNSTIRITTQSQKPRRITSVTTSNNNTRLACCFDDFSLELWHIGTGVIIGNRLVGHSDEINCATFCDDGRRVVSASVDTTIRLWDADQGCSWGNPIRGHSGSVTGVAFNSGQGNKIASVSLDKTIRIWDALTGAQLWLSMQRIENLALISFSRSDTKLVCTTHPDMHMYPSFNPDPIVLDVETSQSWTFPPLRWMTFSSNDKIVSLSGNGDFWSWNPVSNYLAGSVSNNFPEHTNLLAVHFSPKRTQAVCIYEETFLAIPDTATGNYVQLPIPEYLDDILAIQWLDGKKLVAIASKRVLRVRDAATCTVLAERY
ncbi:WD40-repeat-containing domain protein [Mycena rebaudengoi]|nr:WD40-repeat-containing domain protein [Mycena rebaudengoi]